MQISHARMRQFTHPFQPVFDIRMQLSLQQAILIQNFQHHLPPRVDQGISQTAYYAEVLGHQENSLTTALSYQKFSIRRKLDETDMDTKEKIATLDSEFKAFSQQIIKKRKRKCASFAWQISK